ESWLTATAAHLTRLVADAVEGGTGEGSSEPPRCCSDEPSPVPSPTSICLARHPEEYLADIAICKQHLLDGETYEICLTNEIEAEAEADPLALYMELRRVNPAPFASYLRLGELAVMSSSPERFLQVGRCGEVEAKPIKGTSPRGGSGEED